MATLTVRNLEDEIVRRLRIQAAEHGRSAEAEHREILRIALASSDHQTTRQQAAHRMEEFRRRTGGRGSAPAAQLLKESRNGRLKQLTGNRTGAKHGPGR